MRSAAAIVVALLAAAACGGDGTDMPADAAVEIDAAPPPPDPFAGMYDGPEDFPRDRCRAGALAGFASPGRYPAMSMRIALEAGELVIYRPRTQLAEQQVPFTLTDDDLLLRVSTYVASSWVLQVYDVCDVTPDGTLLGYRVQCDEFGGTPRCSAVGDLEAIPLRRAAGESEAAGGLSLLGEVRLEGMPINVRVTGTTAVVALRDQGMRTVSVANPAAPVKLAWWQPAEDNDYNDVKILSTGGRRYAVLAGIPSDVVDITDPAQPFHVATIPIDAHTLFLEGTLAYLVGFSPFDLDIVDLSVPTAPVVLSQFQHPQPIFSRGHDLFVAGGIAYISIPERGLMIVDCRDPRAPVALDVALDEEGFRYWHSPWRTEIGGRDVVVHADEGANGLMSFIDVEPGSPQYLQTLGRWVPRPEVSLHNVMALADRVYVAHYEDGVRVLDASDPTAPSLLAYYNTWREEETRSTVSGALGIDLDPANRRIYVADTIRGLMILEGTAAVFP